MKFAKISTIAALFCTSIPLTAATPINEDATPLFKYNGKSFAPKDMEPAAQQALYDAKKVEFETVQKIAEASLLENYFAEQAKKTGKSKEKLEEEAFKSNVSEKDAQKWYDENKARVGGRDFASIKTDIMHYLERLQAEKVRDGLVEKLKKEGKFELSVQDPVSPKFDIATAGHPSKGATDKEAKVTIVEFADYTCPHCKDASSNLKKVTEKYKKNVKFVYLDFPLRPDGVSTKVAEGAICADSQGKFWEYHYMAWEQQGSLGENSPTELAQKLKLDEGKFKACMQAPETKQRVAESRTEGLRLGVQGTPSIYVNGRKVMTFSDQDLEAEIKKYL